MANRTPATFEGFHPTWTRWLEVRSLPQPVSRRHHCVPARRLRVKERARRTGAPAGEVYNDSDLLRGIMEGSSDLIAAIDAGYRYIASISRTVRR